MNCLVVIGREALLFMNDTNGAEIRTETDYLTVLFDVLEMLLANKEYSIFERAVKLLNTANDGTVLLKLGKLYYKYGFKQMAREELIKSIKLFDAIDKEGFGILQDVYQ